MNGETSLKMTPTLLPTISSFNRIESCSSPSASSKIHENRIVAHYISIYTCMLGFVKKQSSHSLRTSRSSHAVEFLHSDKQSWKWPRPQFQSHVVSGIVRSIFVAFLTHKGSGCQMFRSIIAYAPIGIRREVIIRALVVKNRKRWRQSGFDRWNCFRSPITAKHIWHRPRGF